MAKYIIYPLALLCLFACKQKPLTSEITFRVLSASPYHDEQASLYIAGNFNGWNPSDTSFLMKHQGNGVFELKKTFPATLEGSIEYKYTRGSWDTVESDGNGGNIANREMKYKMGLVLSDTIQGWDLEPPKSSALSSVKVFHESMQMPTLNRQRRVWVCLPADYESSTNRYPVIYMHDGQNLFDQTVGNFGEWEVDETMRQLEEQYGFSAIIVGIDHGDSLRLREYSPYTHPKYGGGEGDEYLDFIVNTLKPAIDATFRTIPDRENTAIAGSSMGGLISFCAGIQHAHVFSKLFVFSPSFWFNHQVYEDAQQLMEDQGFQIYLLVGTDEGGGMVNATKKMQAILESSGKFTADNLKTSIVKGGKHNENFWKQEFPKALKWMYKLN